MKHITEDYGEQVNRLECTTDEFYAMSEFLLKIGVEVRMCSRFGDTIIAQARNEHRELCKLLPDGEGQSIDDMAEANIMSGSWRR